MFKSIWWGTTKYADLHGTFCRPKTVSTTAAHFVARSQIVHGGDEMCRQRRYGDKLCRGDKMCRNTPFISSIESNATFFYDRWDVYALECNPPPPPPPPTHTHINWYCSLSKLTFDCLINNCNIYIYIFYWGQRMSHGSTAVNDFIYST